jgi:hypothetical protein
MSGAAAMVANVKAGTRLIADGGFPCLIEGEVCAVEQDEERGLYVACSRGRHYLDGQLDEHDRYIGFSVVKEPA